LVALDEFEAVRAHSGAGTEGRGGMSDITDATPRPWWIYGTNPQDFVTATDIDMQYPGIESADHTIVLWGSDGNKDDGGVRGSSKEESAANAALIVRAVNERDELIAALRSFAKIADDYDRAYEQRVKLSDGHRVSISLGECREARAVLAKAEAP
jgi:hypothetical protein